MLANRVRAVKRKLDGYTKTLLHMNGEGGYTAFRDEASRIWTPYNGAYTSNAQKKLGSESAFFDGIEGYITTPYSADFVFGLGDFTIDFWIRRVSGVSKQVLGQADSSYITKSINVSTDGSARLVVNISFGDGSINRNLVLLALTLDTWFHIAIVRASGIISCYQDGVWIKGENTLGGYAIASCVSAFSIGRVGDYSGGYSNMFIDEFRISKGIARWTSNFTPPTIEY
jgi:hypothetical protein